MRARKIKSGKQYYSILDTPYTKYLAIIWPNNDYAIYENYIQIGRSYIGTPIYTSGDFLAPYEFHCQSLGYKAVEFNDMSELFVDIL